MKKDGKKRRREIMERLSCQRKIKKVTIKGFSEVMSLKALQAIRGCPQKIKEVGIKGFSEMMSS